MKKQLGSVIYMLATESKNNKDLARYLGVSTSKISKQAGSLLTLRALRIDPTKPYHPYIANPTIIVEYILASDIVRLFCDVRPGTLDKCEELLEQIVCNFLNEYYSGFAYALDSWESWPPEYKERIPFDVLIHPLLNKEKNIFAAFSEHILSANLLLVAEEIQKLGHDDLRLKIQELSENRYKGHTSGPDYISMLRFILKRDFDVVGGGDPDYAELFKKYMLYNSKTHNIHRENTYKVMRGKNINYLQDTAEALSDNYHARLMLVFFSSQEYGRSEWFGIKELIFPEKAKWIKSKEELLNRAGALLLWNFISPDSIYLSTNGNIVGDMWDLLTPIMSPDIVKSSEKEFHFGMTKLLEETITGYLEHVVQPMVKE